MLSDPSDKTSKLKMFSMDAEKSDAIKENHHLTTVDSSSKELQEPLSTTTSESTTGLSEAIDFTIDDVNAIVPNHDYEGEANTLRMWVLCFAFGTVISGVDAFFRMRFPTIHISAIVAQVLAFPVAKVWDLIIPPWSIPLPFGRKISLNSGPFNPKEHACIFIFVNYISSAALVNDNVAEQFKFFNRDIGINHMILFHLSCYFCSFCFAGLALPILVSPANVVWPGLLSTCALFKVFHNSENKPAGNWTISRLKFFSIVFGASFIWFWFPDLILPFLSSIGAWISWIRPDNATLSQLFGVKTGLGLFPLTFDWTQITSVSNPLATPFWSLATVFVSFVFWIWIVMPALYYQNKWQVAHFPIMTSSIYNVKGKSYDTSKIVNKNYVLDYEKFKKYSPVMLPIAFLMNVALGLAAFASMIISFIFRFKSDVIEPLKNPTKDAHNEALSKYKTFPWWIYPIVGAIGLGFGFAFFEGFDIDVQLRAGGFIVSMLIGACLFLPLALIESRSNFVVSLAPFFQVISAFWLKGQPIALMYFYMSGFGTMQHAVHASQSAKIGHYMKVPPKTVMSVLFIASIWGPIVSVAVSGYILEHFKNICTSEAANNMVCRKAKAQFNSLAVWGLFGEHLFAGNGRYSWVLWFFLVGGLVAIIVCLIEWKFAERSVIKKLNPTLFFAGAGDVPSVTGYNISTWFVVGFILNYIIHRRKHLWWKKYNLVLAVGMDCGVAICALIIYFCVVYPGGSANYSWWATKVAKGGCDAKGCPHLTSKVVVPTGW